MSDGYGVISAAQGFPNAVKVMHKVNPIEIEKYLTVIIMFCFSIPVVRQISLFYFAGSLE